MKVTAKADIFGGVTLIVVGESENEEVLLKLISTMRNSGTSMSEDQYGMKPKMTFSFRPVSAVDDLKPEVFGRVCNGI